MKLRGPNDPMTLEVESNLSLVSMALEGDMEFNGLCRFIKLEA